MSVSGKMDLREAEMFFGFSTLLSKPGKNVRGKMKVGILIVGTILMILSGIGFVVCLILPGINSHVSVQEATLVAVPLGILCFLSFVLTIVSAIFVLKSKKKGVSAPSSAN